MDPFRGDDEEEFNSSERDETGANTNPSGNLGGIPDRNHHSDEIGTIDDNSNENVSIRNASSEQVLHFDRRQAFVIDDAPDLGSECFMAFKRALPQGSRVGLRKMTAIAVREHGTQKFAKLIRFLYTVPTVQQESLNTCVAVPKAN